MTQIEVVYKDHMGNDLSVISAAKESFNRKAEWEYKSVPSYKEYHDDMNCNGWEYVDEDTATTSRYRRLKPRDQDLMRMLARGMGKKEYEDLKEKIRVTNDPDVIEELIWKFRHTTPHLAPFGHCYASFRFKAPVFVMRHIVKHEYIRISELSMRYVRGMPEYFKPKSWRAMAENVKQGSGGDHDDQEHWFDILDDSEYEDDEIYQHALQEKLCPEQARTFLRLCHMTEGTFSGSMDALSGIVIKRLDPHAQEETREFARQLDAHMFNLYPKAWEALTEGVAR